MKKIIFIITLFVCNLNIEAQNYKDYPIGDTIFLKNRIPVLRANANFYAIIKEKVIVNKKNLYKMEAYECPKDSTRFSKHSIYYTIDPNLISSYHKHIDFHRNGTKSAEGFKEKGRPYGIWNYWYENGQRKEVQKHFKYQALEKNAKEPEVISFWNENGEQTIENGNGTYLIKKDSMITKGYYKNGVKHGKFSAITNGKKFYEDFYKNGELTQGKSWDKNGKEYTYDIVFKTAQYPGGQKAISKHISKNIKIPEYAYFKNISGRVILMLKIDKKGKIYDVKVVKSLCRPCDLEAIRVVRRMKKWKPGEIRGRKVNVAYTLPITFKI